MNRMKCLLAVVAVAAIVAVVPASAQTIHVAGAGSSAQFLSAAIGADSLALAQPGVVLPANCSGSDNTTYHYSVSNGAFVVDARSSNIVPEKGNVWIVWIAACSDTTGATGVTDIWLDVSVDSTVGVRSVLAQESSGPGAQIGISTPPASAGNLISATSGLWPDNHLDVNLPSAVYNVIGTGITNSTVGTDVHVNAGLTDIRAEDALFATTRAINNFTTTLSGLGYRLITGNANYGVSIASGQQGSTAIATPENFSLGGGIDPVTGETVPSIVTSTLGAAPMVFAYNNNGIGSGNYPTDLTTGVLGDGNSSGSFPLAHLFDGTTKCDTTNAAFGSFSGPTVNVNPILREPLSGTMNTTEFNLFRTTGNTTDSQELGVSRAASAGGPLNPLNSSNGGCSAGGGFRTRAIGTGEVVGKVASGANQGIIGNANYLGYFFWSFSNSNKFYGSGLTPANYNYFTLDGVDPLGGIGQSGQTFYHCTTTNCASSLWPSNISFPTLRNGSYGTWSIYRWISYASNTDPLGPAALVQAAQDAVDTTIADYVPFYTAAGGIGGVSDGLAVYRSHFTRTGPASSCGGTGCTSGKTIVGVNGTATAANTTDGGNDLGVGDRGGDEGGVIEGPFATTDYTSGYVTVPSTGDCVVNKGWKISHKTNAGSTDFKSGTSWEGQTITIGGANYTVASVALTTTTLYVGGYSGGACTGPQPPADPTLGAFYIINQGGSPAATGAGVLNKHR
jgi:hypothetical protein